MTADDDALPPIATSRTGLNLLSQPLFNKGTAFTDEERDAFGLHGLLPPHVGTLEEQVSRRLRVLRAFHTDFERYAFLRELQDVNETLFYALVASDLEEMLPLVYTPTVGEGCQRFSEIWHKPRGLFLSYTNRHRIAEMFADARYDDVRVIVVSDGERILGLGDQGAGGMGIPIGKLALYTACAGVRPGATLPVLLDVGTNNRERLEDPLYIGWRHERVTGASYDEFVEAFVEAAIARWPSAMLHWEDFAGHNAGRLLARYADRLCTFNDDIQGTAAVATASLLAAVHVTGGTLADQRIAILGAGSAGTGIAALLCRAMVESGASEADARARFWLVDRDGLLMRGAGTPTPAQQPFVRDAGDLAGWTRESHDRVTLFDVAANAEPTVLIGTSGVRGAFEERVVRELAKHVARPVIFPLSNPTSRSEATPQELAEWTDGRAIVGTGSPFAPAKWHGATIAVNQTNNAYVFPGVGLGVLASNARRITDAMFMASARALAAMSPAASDPRAALLPPVPELHACALAVARAVARQAREEGVADAIDDAALDARIAAEVWTPRYRRYVRP